MTVVDKAQSFYPTGEVQRIYILSGGKNGGKKNTSTLKPGGPSVSHLPLAVISYIPDIQNIIPTQRVAESLV